MPSGQTREAIAAKQQRVARHLGQGFSYEEIARMTGMSQRTIVRYAGKIRADRAWKDGQAQEQKHPSGKTTRESRWALEGAAGPGAVAVEDLRDEARKALDDFAYFRRRYFGRLSTPWQEEAAYRVIEFLQTPDKEYVVINCPPGSGKSKLFTHDIPAWVTCRNRGIRGLIGTVSQTKADSYLLQLRQSFERRLPEKAEAQELALGLAFDAEATLIGDYGMFKPAEAVLWTRSAIIVAQLGEQPITEKEPTWEAVGLGTAIIGGRYDLCIWDDAEDDRMLRSAERIEGHRLDWDKVAEARLEPGGLLVLQGQRLGPEDIYRYNLDKRVGSSDEKDHDGCCSALPGRKYHHIVYRAHWEERCQGRHGRDDLEYYPKSCLLDPRRLPYRELESHMENALSNFMQVYQQEDIDPDLTLVNPVWVSGGTDPRTGRSHPGCWDKMRGLCELPPDLSGSLVSYITTDPSATMMWSVQWWVYHPDSGCRFLMDLLQKKLTVNQYLDYDTRFNRYEGVLHDWVNRSREMGWPVTSVIWERNAAQRYFLATNMVREWEAQMGIQIIAHDTYAANKLDSDLGVQRLAPLFARGLVRLPCRGEESKFQSLLLVNEAQKWPKGRTEDNVMAMWFGEYNLEHLWTPDVTPFREWRPSWMTR